MKIIVAVVCAAMLAFVTGCTTAQNAQIDATVQKSLPPICANAERAKPVIELLIASGKIKGKTADRVTTALDTLDTLCVDPSQQTAASVLTAALTAYLTVSSAMKSAQAS